MEHPVLDQVEVAEQQKVIDVCPVHGCVYDDRGLCELCEEEKAMPIWATPQQKIKVIMAKIPGGSFKNGDSSKNGKIERTDENCGPSCDCPGCVADYGHY